VSVTVHGRYLTTESNSADGASRYEHALDVTRLRPELIQKRRSHKLPELLVLTVHIGPDVVKPCPEYSSSLLCEPQLWIHKLRRVRPYGGVVCVRR